MRTTRLAALAAAVILAAATSGRAGDREQALALVQEAIKAHGGEEALNQVRILSRTGAGTMSAADSSLPFTEESILALPDRLRMSMDLNKRHQVTLVLNRDKGWQAIGGTVFELGKERLDEIREEAYALWLTTLTPLLQTAITLTPVPDISVDGVPAAGVKVTAKGHFDAKLYFDKRSHLLVKLERRTREAGLLLDKAYLFGDYKDVDGVKLPVRQSEWLNGKKLIERTSATYKVLRSVDEKTFGKP